MLNEGFKTEDGIIFLSKPSDCFMADEWYDMATSDHFWMKWRHAIIRKFIPREYFNGPVLEVGCGFNTVRKMIEDEYLCKIDGCDLNLAALKEAVPVKGNTYFYNLHDRRQEFSGKYETIFLLDVLEHIENPNLFLESVCFHLKAGGRLIVNIPAFPSLYSKYDKVAGHFRRYNRMSLMNELGKAGLTIEDSSYWGMTLVPILLLRKLVVMFLKEENVIQTGFNPKAKIIDAFLQGLRAFETGIFRKVPFGTSLFAVVKKKE